ncbi:MAG: SGNH/GDSL hydrolase family protein, partial [Clostridia bacterium]|nr:SGNH/GDSL hydrolase family protein [Clostridia bacterium]
MIYTTSNTDIIPVSGNTITALKKGKATVTAKAQGYDTTKTFQVTVKSLDEGADSSSVKARSYNTDAGSLTSKKNDIANRVTAYDEKNLTLVCGDSFTDTAFWTDFYTSRFATKNAITVGISATRASQWQWWMQEYYKYNPKNIIMHIGTNDCYDGQIPAAETTTYLRNIFNGIHNACPDTVIYWWTIEARLYDNQESRKFAASQTTIINSNIMKFAEGKSWLKVVNTRDALVPALYKSGDNTHPSCPAGYDALMAKTYEAGFTVADKPSKPVKLGDITVEMNTSACIETEIAGATGNFVFETTVTINEKGNNAHVDFRLDKNSNERLLLWDASNTNTFYYRGLVGKTSGNSTDHFDW